MKIGMRFGRGLPGAFLAALLLTAAPMSAAGPRVEALVVGVETGSGAIRRGAQDLAAQFVKMGFGTKLLVDKEDTHKAELERAMDGLAERAKQADIVIFAYGGHGIEYKEVNYLVPTGAVLSSSADIMGQLVALPRLFTALDDLPDVAKIFVFDACRSLPHGTWPSLGKPKGDLPDNSLVAYSAPPGEFALEAGPDRRYSTFTESLIHFLPGRGRSVNDLFALVGERTKQETTGPPLPWTVTRLRPDLKLLPEVRLDARFTTCDDLALIFHNGVLKRACPDSALNEPIVLVPGPNLLAVGIYNQKSWENGREPINLPFVGTIFGVAEGWFYEAEVTLEGRLLRKMAAREDHTLPEGPRHGRFFFASQLTLDLDEYSGQVTVIHEDPEFWRRLR